MTDLFRPSIEVPSSPDLAFSAPNAGPVGFNRSDDTCWLFTEEIPCFARFSARLFEIQGRTSSHNFNRSKSGLEHWTDFVAAIEHTTGQHLPDYIMPLNLWSESHGADTQPTFSVATKILLAYANPFQTSPWPFETIDKDEVRLAIKDSRFEDAPVDPDDRAANIARIAWLALNPKSWFPIAIELDFSGDFEITDGYHRLAAASLLGRETISFTHQGAIDPLEKALPMATPDF